MTSFKSRFQQEREQRRLEMFGSNSTTTVANNLQVTLGNGRVRQMFDDRRRGVGIDRSSPLKPITSTNRLLSHSTTNVATKPNSLLNSRVVAAKTTTTNVNLRNSMNSVGHANSQRPIRKSYHEQQAADRTYGDAASLTKGLSTLSLSDNRVKERAKYTPPTPTRGNSSTNTRLKPVLTKKSPVSSTAINNNKSNTLPSKRASTVISRQVPEKFSIKAKTSTANGKMPASRVSTIRLVKPMSTRKPSAPPPPGMVACRHCGRHFIEERLAKHEEICQKVVNSKKYIYDAAKHRLHNTDTETFLKKQGSRGTAASQKPSATSTVSGLKKNNWRKKHEEFIAAIRAAKQVQAHLAKGGKLSDLPPPPPSENADYVQCPHCLRRFNEAAASRHIPKCANMLHNKPKPGANKKR